ncbi:hypothetical protein DFH27DRAFT_597901 [Peziza echinospora]|nr:hypothetical protein DFH27DRAFT_597901 [Peziza echinospora]
MSDSEAEHDRHTHLSGDGGGGGGAHPPTYTTSSTSTSTATDPPLQQEGKPTATTTTTTTTNTSAAAAAAATPPSMTPEEITSLLNRLSQKEKVQSLLILSRALNGAIVKAIGLRVSEEQLQQQQELEGTGGGSGSGGADGDTAAEYAALVWKFVRSAEEMVVAIAGIGGKTGASAAVVAPQAVGGAGAAAQAQAQAQVVAGPPADELKLLRVRTRRHELVIVPDAQYILVVIHDTPGK